MTEEAAPAAPEVSGDGHLATQIIGENVYNGTGDDAQSVGDVNDIVLGADGKIEAVVVGVGGFLGIGEKDVAVDFAQLEWAERDGDRWLVAPMTKEQLETQAAFDRSAYEPEQPVASNDPAAYDDASGGAWRRRIRPRRTLRPRLPPSLRLTLPPRLRPQPRLSRRRPAPEAPADQMAQNPAPADPAAPAPDASTDTTTTGAIDKSTLTELPGDRRSRRGDDRHDRLRRG